MREREPAETAREGGGVEDRREGERERVGGKEGTWRRVEKLSNVCLPGETHTASQPARTV